MDAARDVLLAVDAVDARIHARGPRMLRAWIAAAGAAEG